MRETLKLFIQDRMYAGKDWKQTLSDYHASLLGKPSLNMYPHPYIMPPAKFISEIRLLHLPFIVLRF
jgi:hypothetical protein